MPKKIYINGLGSIHPDIISVTEANPLLCVDPDYKSYLDAGSARRLSKLLKRAIVASKIALTEAEIEMPDAIITGTGLGCLEDTEKFLNNVLEDELGALSPTSFIQSTHNTISGQIALLLKCHGYNTTYAQRSLSFEQAVEDAQLWLQQDDTKHVLVGAADEIPADTHKILQKTRVYRPVESQKQLPTAGEGVHYFVLSVEKKASSKAVLAGVHYQRGEISLESELKTFLSSLSLSFEHIDAVILGNNGHGVYDKHYEKAEHFFPTAALVRYKHLVGECFTATGFAWKLACESLEKGKIDPLFIVKNSDRPLKTILLYNQFQNIEHSFALFQHV